jgi:ParB/RepB/Spo0J family partition protein
MANAASSNTLTVPEGKYMKLALGAIVCDRNIRTDDPAILNDDGMDLVASIEANGVLEPVLVVKGEDRKYHLRAGFRRCAAVRTIAEKNKRPWAKELVPAIAFTVSEVQSQEIALVENLQRKEMNAFDRAVAIAEIMNRTGCEAAQMAKRLGMTPGSISQHLSLLKMPAAIQKEVKSGNLTFTVARTLARIKDANLVIKAFEAVEAKGLDAVRTKHLVEEMLRREQEPRRETEEVRGKPAQKTGTPERRPPASGQNGKAVTAEETAVPLAERMRGAKLRMRSESTVRNLLVEWASKADAARSPERRREYELVLRGLALAAGIDLG